MFIKSLLSSIAILSLLFWGHFSTAIAKNDPMGYLLRSPNEENLTTFKLYCKEDNPIDYRSQPRPQQLLKKALETGKVNLLRAMIFSLGHCAEGKSARYLHTILDHEVRVKYPENLAEALRQEHKKSLNDLP